MLSPLERGDRTGELGASIRGGLALLFLGVTVILCNAVMMLTLLVWPFSRTLFRYLNRSIAGLWWGWVVKISLRMNHFELVRTGDEIPDHENSIVFCNHQEATDIIILLHLAAEHRQLPHLKWFVKDVVKWVPGVGWGMLFLDCVFLKRSWNRDVDSIRRTFSKFINHKIPFWLISFVEGTRITPEKLEKNREWAGKRGQEKTDHVMVPRARGFVASVQGLESVTDAIYDVTLGYEEGLPNLWHFTKGWAPRVHLHLRRYPVDTLPMETKALKQWLFDRFYEKDRLLEDFYREGVFLDNSG